MAKPKATPQLKEPFWDKEVPSGEVITGATSKFTVTICFKDGKKFINITRWTCTQKSQEWKPIKGLAIPSGQAGLIYRAIRDAAIQSGEVQNNND